MRGFDLIWFTVFVMCRSRKNPCPPHGRSLGIPRGRGILRVHILEAKYEAKPELPTRREMQKEKHKSSVGGGGGGDEYFLELHNLPRVLNWSAFYCADCGIPATVCWRRRCILVDVHYCRGSCSYVILFKHFDWCSGGN